LHDKNTDILATATGWFKAPPQINHSLSLVGLFGLMSGRCLAGKANRLSLADAFAVRAVRYALIGGLAIAMRGRARLTQDIDFLVDVSMAECGAQVREW
jgi:hypothetical protein